MRGRRVRRVERALSERVLALEGAIAAFAREAGLTFVEVVLAATAEGLRVVDVNHQPQLERFTDRRAGR